MEKEKKLWGHVEVAREAKYVKINYVMNIKMFFWIHYKENKQKYIAYNKKRRYSMYEQRERMCHYEDTSRSNRWIQKFI